MTNATHLSVELVADQQTASVGGNFQAGIYFKLEKEWHIYWQNPGDSGIPPQITWNLQPGVQASSILWPPPSRIEAGPLVNYGYRDEVLLPVPIQLDSSFHDDSVHLQGLVRWLVCREVCIPGKANLELTIPVHAGAAVSNPTWAPLFEATAKMLPTPQPSNWKLAGTLDKDHFKFSVSGITDKVSAVSFFPSAGDEVDHAAPVKIQQSPGAIALTLNRSDRLANDVDHFPGLLVLSDQSGSSHAFQVDFPLGGAHSASAILPILAVIFSAFVGGLFLNLMPCVFPVLSLKVMSLLKISGQEKSRVRKLGLAYTAGILVSFWILITVLLVLRFTGQQIGWGFQLQSPRFVFVLACVLFAFALNLLGMFEITGSFVGAGNSLANKEGLTGSFFTGVLATLVATPCTAPFMGSAVGFALTQTPFVVFLIFTSLGLGLSAPYLLVSYFPKLGGFLPKPGLWMETFKELMAFLIFGTVIWLAWVLQIQTSAPGLIILMSGFVGIGFAVWLSRRGRAEAYRWLGVLIGILSVFSSCLALRPATSASNLAIGHEGGLTWEKFSPEKLEEYRAKNEPVFVDFTAAWCVSCQVNELLVFQSEAVKEKLRALGFHLMKADWTNEDPVITKTLASFNRNGVPFYLIYGKGKDVPAVQLPEVINAGLVLNELEKIK
jgi:thiol:disulfide interchange protein